MKGRMPVHAVSKKLKIYFVPKILSKLNKLEQVLISHIFLFKKTAIMPRKQFLKLKGNICNIPVNTSDIINAVPYSADSYGLVVVKLRQKLSYCGHVYFEAVRPESFHMALKYLKENNPLYYDIHVYANNVLY